MLVFAGFIPSSPLLLKSINEARLAEAKNTSEALEELSQELYAAHPDTLVILSEGTTMYPDAFSVTMADPYLGDLTAFGDLGYQKNYHPDFAFIDKLQREVRKSDLPVSLSTDDKLSSLTTVALELVTDHLAKIKLVPVAPTELDSKSHFSFGNLLKHLILDSDKRIAVIAAGDMSQAVSKQAPAGYHRDGKAFDQAIQELIKEKNTAGLLQMPEKLLKNSHNTCYRQLCILFGVLDGIQVTSNILSYQAPFGVGYCVTNFVL